jgi:peroxiredoxin
MGRTYFILIWLLLLGCSHKRIIPPELPKNFEIQTTKIKCTIDSSFHLIISPLISSNLRAALYPKITGIPDSLNDISKFITPIDYIQSVFQAYKGGIISKDDCQNFLRINIKDTILCTSSYVKTFVIIVTGTSKTGNKYYLFDSNNNFDLSDEQVFSLNEGILKYQPHKILYEKFVNGKIQSDSTWIAFNIKNKPDYILLKFCEQIKTSFNFDSIQYNLTAYSKYGTRINYTEETIFEISDSINKNKQIFENNQYAHLSDLYYLVNCGADGRTITFVLDTNALEKGSTQVNMPAIPFTAVTIKGDTVNFPEDFNGKYVLLDFWSTGCPHCIVDIRTCYRDLYKEFSGPRFEILGIADDPKNKVEKFVSQNMIKWPMISAQGSLILESYRVEAYPALFLVDPDGIIISKGQELNKEKINVVIGNYLNQ